MPKVFLTEKDKLNDRVTAWIFGQMRLKNLSQREVAEELSISQQLLSYRLKHRIISISDFATFVRLFQPETDEIMRLIGKTGE